MSDFIKFNEIIEVLPELLIYLVPGFIFIIIRNYYLSIDSNKDKYIILKSIVVSYILVKALSLFFSSKGYFFTILVILVAIGFSIIYIKLDLENSLLKFFKLQKSTNEDCMSNIINIKGGAWVYAYVPKENVIYCGKLIHYHYVSEGNEMIIVLSNYALYSYNGDEIDNYLTENVRNIMLNTKEISRIEIVK